MRDERGGAALLVVLFLIALAGLIGYSLNRTGGMSAVTGHADEKNDTVYYIAEAGVQNAIWSMQHGVRTGSFVNKTFGNGTFTVTFADNLDNTISITSVGQSSGSTEEIDARIPLSCGQTVTFTATSDTYINQNSPNINYGSSIRLIEDRNAIRPLISFDLSTIPATAIVQSAILSLYDYSSTKKDSVFFYRVTQSWAETEATWINRRRSTAWSRSGGAYDGSKVWKMSTNLPGWATVDITPLVTLWVNGTYSNYGIIGTGNSGADFFYSKDYTIDPTLAPKLTVSWTC